MTGISPIDRQIALCHKTPLWDSAYWNHAAKVFPITLFFTMSGEALEIADRSTGALRPELLHPLNQELQAQGLAVAGGSGNLTAEILTPEAVLFVGKLEKTFGQRRRALLARRQKVQSDLDAGIFPEFSTET